MTVILQPTCLKCLDVALSLRPEHTAALHLLQQFFLEGPGAADPTFKQEFTIGLKLVDQARSSLLDILDLFINLLLVTDLIIK